MQETEFHTLADAALNRWFERLSPAYDAGDIEELELQNGILSVVFADGRTLILNKHAVSQQLWLASPRLGGLHFGYTDSQWKLTDGRILDAVMKEEQK